MFWFGVGFLCWNCRSVAWGCPAVIWQHKARGKKCFRDQTMLAFTKAIFETLARGINCELHFFSFSRSRLSFNRTPFGCKRFAGGYIRSYNEQGSCIACDCSTGSKSVLLRWLSNRWMDNKRKFFIPKCVFDDPVRNKLLSVEVKGDQTVEGSVKNLTLKFENFQL